MEKEEFMYVHNDIYYESDLSEVINYLVETDQLKKEDIIGYKVDIAEKEPVMYKNFDIDYLMDIIDGNFGDDRYDEDGDVSDNIRNVFKKHVNFEELKKDLEKICLFYQNGKSHTITEDDWNNYINQ